ncbi:MAG: HAMP domain-containing histidine kinase [Anaerolineae bacterium]|nr:HAMP domain-containing histidine kinase [Anaerolineae bacterium]
MSEIDLLRSIRPIWLSKVVQKVARGENVRDDFRNELERFFDSVEQVIETGELSWMDTMLHLYATSLTQTDLEISNSNLTQFINQIMLLIFSACRERLGEADALKLIEALMPAYAYATEKAAQYEIDNQVEFTTKKLTQVQNNLEKLNQSKSDFITVAAHELKTPLTLINGYTAMLYENLEQKGSAPEYKMLVDGILTGVARLQSIVDNMIDVSLIDNNLLEVNFQPTWIQQIIKSLHAELEKDFLERRQTFTFNQFPGCDEMIYGDPERLMQAFRNVLLNAIKFTPDGGRIMVDGRKLPGFIEVIISDTGIGIDPDMQPVIFEKFFRIGNTALHSSGKTKYKGGGPGLGLHIAKGIIEAHGGSIWVESPGYDEQKLPGSTFHLLLPMLKEKPANLAKEFMDASARVKF